MMTSQQFNDNPIGEPIEVRKALNFALKTWLLGTDKGGIVRTKLFRITTLEQVTGDNGGNLRRWLAQGLGARITTEVTTPDMSPGYLPTLKTLQSLSGYLKEYGFVFM